jgi:hypothetical protein
MLWAFLMETASTSLCPWACALSSSLTTSFFLKLGLSLLYSDCSCPHHKGQTLRRYLLRQPKRKQILNSQNGCRNSSHET